MLEREAAEAAAAHVLGHVVFPLRHDALAVPNSHPANPLPTPYFLNFNP